MQLHILPFIVALFATTHASPIAVDDPTTYEFIWVNPNDYCWDPTFENQSSPASPLIDDCIVIMKNIASMRLPKPQTPLLSITSNILY